MELLNENKNVQSIVSFRSTQFIFIYLINSELVQRLLFFFFFQIFFNKKFSELFFSKVDVLSKFKFKVSPMHLITLKR